MSPTGSRRSQRARLWWWCMEAGRRLMPRWPRRAFPNSRSMGCASPTPVRSTSSSRCWLARSTRGWWRRFAKRAASRSGSLAPMPRWSRCAGRRRSRAVAGPKVDLGLVGLPINNGAPKLLTDLLARGYVPIVACLGATRDGQLLNVNADTLASHLASQLGARRLIIAGGTAGVLDAAGQTIERLTRARRGAVDQDGHRQQGNGREARSVSRGPS